MPHDSQLPIGPVHRDWQALGFPRDPHTSFALPQGSPLVHPDSSAVGTQMQRAWEWAEADTEPITKWVVDQSRPQLKPSTWRAVNSTMLMFLGMVQRVYGDTMALDITLLLQPVVLAEFLVSMHVTPT